jgi:hypothetical protein
LYFGAFLKKHNGGKAYLCFALVCGALTTMAGSMMLLKARSYFSMPPLPVDLASQIKPFEPIPLEVNAALNTLERNTALKNAILTFTLIAFASLPLMGLTVGFFVEMPSAAVRGATAGLLTASPIGIATGSVGIFVAKMLSTAFPDGDDVFLIFSVHAIMWIVFALGITITVVSTTGIRSTFLSTFAVGSAAATIASVCFHLSLMVLLPMGRPEGLLPNDVLSSSMFVGFGVGLPWLSICYATGKPDPATFDKKKSNLEQATET